MLLDRACARAHRLAMLQAISHLNSVDRRLLALFWHLAERWGRVTPDGIVVPLTLSHRLLAEIVGARRPTVTVGIAALERRGKLLRLDDASWLLLGEPPGAPADGARRVVPHRRRLLATRARWPSCAQTPARSALAQWRGNRSRMSGSSRTLTHIPPSSLAGRSAAPDLREHLVGTCEGHRGGVLHLALDLRPVGDELEPDARLLDAAAPDFVGDAQLELEVQTNDEGAADRLCPRATPPTTRHPPRPGVGRVRTPDSGSGSSETRAVSRSTIGSATGEACPTRRARRTPTVR